MFLYNWTRTKTTSEKFWIGGSDKITEGEWTWTDGSPMNYTNWGTEEPSETDWLGRQEDCLTIDLRDGTWNNKVCDTFSHTKQSVCSQRLCPG